MRQYFLAVPAHVFSEPGSRQRRNLQVLQNQKVSQSIENNLLCPLCFLPKHGGISKSMIWKVDSAKNNVLT